MHLFFKRINSMFVLLGGVSVCAVAQIGGRNSFEFMNVSPSARLSALGGVNVSLADRDINFFAMNPALAGDTLSGVAAVNYLFYAGDVGQAFFAYAHNFHKIGTVMFGLQHMGYGDIQGYDASGMETGEFRAGETALMAGKQHQVGNFRIGATVKAAFSNIAGYRASALLVDAGGVFMHPQQQLSVGIAIKNAGLVLSDYGKEARSGVPFDVQVGTTFKPEHMPLRFSLTAFNLTRADVTYYDSRGGESEPGVVKKMLSHLNLGAEVLIHKNVTLLAGYNFLAHQALKLAAGGGGAGIGLGFAATVRSFEVVFSRSAYVAGNAGYSFTLSSHVNKILKRR